MVPCVLGMSLHNSEAASKHTLWTWELGPCSKSNIFHLGKLDNWSLKPVRKTHWFIFILITITVLVKFLSFLDLTGFLPLLACHLIVYFHLIRVPTGMAVKTHRTLYPDFFSHKIVQCAPGVSLHSSKTAVKNVFVNLGIGIWWQKKKKVFSPSESWIVSALNLPDKHTG